MAAQAGRCASSAQIVAPLPNDRVLCLSLRNVCAWHILTLLQEMLLLILLMYLFGRSHWKVGRWKVEGHTRWDPLKGSTSG